MNRALEHSSSLQCVSIVGSRFPDYSLEASLPDGSFKRISILDTKGWKVIFSWPKDFTFVCPTEIQGFGALVPEFEKRNASLFGMSTDTVFVHKAWRAAEPMVRQNFPFLSDVRRDLSHSLGILTEDEKVCMRATYIIDPYGVIKFFMVSDMSVGRNPQEVLRNLDALQTERLCGCSWKKGDEYVATN